MTKRGDPDYVRLVSIYGFCWYCGGARDARRVDHPRFDGSVYWFGCTECGREAT